MSYLNNMFLKVLPDVVLDPTIQGVIEALEPWFSAEGLPCVVTSGVRTAEKQLSIIVQKAIQHGIDQEFPQIKTATVEDVNSWINSWGKLLTVGEMINPPVPAHAPYSYNKPNGDVRPAGTFIDISDHMKGGAFDIGLGGHTLVQITSVLDKAKTDPTVLIKDYLAEPVNLAIHIDCNGPKLGNF